MQDDSFDELTEQIELRGFSKPINISEKLNRIPIINNHIIPILSSIDEAIEEEILQTFTVSSKLVPTIQNRSTDISTYFPLFSRDQTDENWPPF